MGEAVAVGRGAKRTSRRLPREVRRGCFRGSGSVARSRLAPLQRRRHTAKVAAPAVPVLGRLRRPIRGRDRPAVLRYARCERGVHTTKAERKERTIRGNELEIDLQGFMSALSGRPCQISSRAQRFAGLVPVRPEEVAAVEIVQRP